MHLSCLEQDYVVKVIDNIHVPKCFAFFFPYIQNKFLILLCIVNNDLDHEWLLNVGEKLFIISLYHELANLEWDRGWGNRIEYWQQSYVPLKQ